MGNVSFGTPTAIVEKMRTEFKLGEFVETGTYLGNTAAWASEQFERVFTIEGSPDFHQQASKHHQERRNIEFLLGDSRTMLSEVVARLGNTPALFWLDAHWMPGSFGQANECPVIEEIAAIHQSQAEHFILIDDARLFLAPPPLPHRAKDWPDIGAVLSALNIPGRLPNYTVVYNDVIISVPAHARASMCDFYQQQTTSAFEEAQRPATNPARKILGGIKRRILG